MSNLRKRLVLEMNNSVREELRMGLDPPLNLKDIAYLAGLLGFNARQYRCLKIQDKSTTLLAIDEWTRINPDKTVTDLRLLLEKMKRDDLCEMLKSHEFIDRDKENCPAEFHASLGKSGKVPLEHVDLSDVYNDCNKKPVEYVDMSMDDEDEFDKKSAYRNGFNPEIASRNPTEMSQQFSMPERLCPPPRGCALPSDKIALVIGNNKYPGRELKQAAWDSYDISRALNHLGFKVMCLLNLTLEEMRLFMITFVRLLDRGVFAVFYYSGHGYESAGENYLVPVDADDPEDRTKCIRAQEILLEMQMAKSLFNLVILDTCQARMAPPTNEQRVDTKLHRVATGNTIIAHSCTKGCYAYEVPGEQRNGIYMRELLKHILRDDRIENILMDVNTAVSKNDYVPQLATFQTDAVFECRLTTPACGIDTGYGVRRTKWAAQANIPLVEFCDTNCVACKIEFVPTPLMQNWLDFIVEWKMPEKVDLNISEWEFKLEVFSPLKCIVCPSPIPPNRHDLIATYSGGIKHLEKLKNETLFVVASWSYRLDGDQEKFHHKFDLGRPMVAGILNNFQNWLNETSV